MEIYLIILLLFITAFASYLAFYYYNENKINYSNYKNTLLALMECDLELKEYLHKHPEKVNNLLSVMEEIPFV